MINTEMELIREQSNIIKSLNVEPNIDPKREIHFRTLFLESYLQKTERSGFVLGISGGQDSALTGKLCQLVVDRLNDQLDTDKYQFIALRLPYGEQKDEEDAQNVLEWINPTDVLTVNIKEAVDASTNQLLKAVSELWIRDTDREFIIGNIKARERMKVHYDIAAALNLIVVGTDHAAEAVTGFFTKYGDGGVDVTPLTGLTKRQGKLLLRYLNGPDFLQTKVPTADLRSDIPQQADEVELGLTYEDIDNFLEGRVVDIKVARKIIDRYRMTEHKRQLPVTPFDNWWMQM